jgi:hypothetical protein
MKKQLAAVVFCAAAVLVVVGNFVRVNVAAQCNKPNLVMTEACYTPPIGGGTLPVGSCIGNSHDQCTGIWGTLYVYQVEPFPVGTVSSPTGATHEPQRPCVRFHGCVWNQNVTPPRCEDAPQWSPWAVKPKIEENPDVTCPAS